MTNSMIPYSFVPGTKAKASEVNANFAAIADIIGETIDTTQANFESINQTLDTKTDKAEYTIDTANTDLNNYTNLGTYVFTDDYTPQNIPQGTSGMLYVIGNIDSTIKQIWFCNDTMKSIYTRDYSNSTWSNWSSITGNSNIQQTGYFKFPNGFMVQWGTQIKALTITYPIAYPVHVGTVITKHGADGNNTRTDSGLINQSLSFFQYQTYGANAFINWFAFGY